MVAEEFRGAQADAGGLQAGMGIVRGVTRGQRLRIIHTELVLQEMMSRECDRASWILLKPRKLV
jgi:hypothetical protein